MRFIGTVANVFLPLALSAPQLRTDTDPICAASVSAYTNAFKAGSDVKTANLIAAKAFYQEFTAQAATRSDPNLSLEPSSCIREAEEYARNAAAMISFFKKAVEVGGSKQLSSVCDSATIAYIDALIAKKPKKKAQEAAADAYVRALTENPNGDPNGVRGRRRSGLSWELQSRHNSSVFLFLEQTSPL